MSTALRIVAARRAAAARRTSLGGEGNALYPVLSSIGLEMLVLFTSPETYSYELAQNSYRSSIALVTAALGRSLGNPGGRSGVRTIGRLEKSLHGVGGVYQVTR